jgi:hypothetical protein
LFWFNEQADLSDLKCYQPVLQATCGTLGLSTATVKLIAPDGQEKIGCSVGTGPVDAAYKAVDQIIQVIFFCILDLPCSSRLSFTGIEYAYGLTLFMVVIKLAVFGEITCSFYHLSS